MKKKLLFLMAMVITCCLALTIGVSAEVSQYDDAPAKSNIQTSVNDLVVFDDGFTCPSAYICKDQTTLALDFAWLNGRAGKTYTVANVKELDIPEGIEKISASYFAKNTTLTKCTFPQTVKEMGACVFQQASALEKVSFEHTATSDFKTLNGWMFYGTAIKAISLPDCITTIDGENHFNECPNLTAVYLPANLTTFTTSGTHEKSSFCGDEKVYFVNDPFNIEDCYKTGSFVAPEKPDVYYFPKNFTTISGEAFKNCKNLNSVLVFGELITSVDNAWTFCNTNSITVVFLGNIKSLHSASNGAWNVSKIYFCNPADLSTADFTIAKSYTYVFCNAEGNTTHLESPRATVVDDATCYSNEKVTKNCFCGKLISATETENSKIDHNYIDDFNCLTPNQCKEYANCHSELPAQATNHSEKQTVEYAQGFTSAGVHKTFCQNGTCNQLDNDVALAPMFGTSGGYSVGPNGGLCGGWTVNTDALKLYNLHNDKDVNYGILMINPKHLSSTQFLKDDYSINLADGKTGAIQIASPTTEYTNISFYVSGFATEELANLELVITAYAYIEGEAVQFIQDATTACKVSTLDYDDGSLYTVNYATASSALSVANMDAVLPNNDEE